MSGMWYLGYASTPNQSAGEMTGLQKLQLMRKMKLVCWFSSIAIFEPLNWGYFPEKERWEARGGIQEPFTADVSAKNLKPELEYQLVDLSCDYILKRLLHKIALPGSWLSVQGKLPELSTCTYPSLTLISDEVPLWEWIFSYLAVTISKHRNVLPITPTSWASLSRIQPRFKGLIKHQVPLVC